MSGLSRTSIQNLVKEVIDELEQTNTVKPSSYSASSVFESVDQAVHYSGIAQKKWIKIPIETKKKIIEKNKKKG